MNRASKLRPVASGAAPFIGAVTGFGTGGGAGVDHNTDAAYGTVSCRVGTGAAASGSFILAFPGTPPALDWAADWATLAVAGAGATKTVTWTATRPLVQGETLAIHYEWTTT